MIHIFYGADRAAAIKEIEKILGPSHETIDAETIEPTDLASLFLGQTFFESERKILIKDLLSIKILAEEVEKYLDTPHEVVLLEQTIDKRQAAIKSLTSSKKIKVHEFKPIETSNPFFTRNLYTEALRDGKSAVSKLRTVESSENAYMIIGSWNSVATKKFLSRPNDRQTRKALKELARIDLLLKTSGFSEKPWPLLESFLLRLKDF